MGSISDGCDEILVMGGPASWGAPSSSVSGRRPPNPVAPVAKTLFPLALNTSVVIAARPRPLGFSGSSIRCDRRQLGTHRGRRQHGGGDRCSSHQFVYVSSAGVYADSELWPAETSPTDPESRHSSKLDTEAWLTAEKIPFTSFRPTYIVGAGNYNRESWFFDRIVHGRPVPLPGDGSTITQLGHVNDLAAASGLSIGVDAATNQFNCSTPRASLPWPGGRRPGLRQGPGLCGDP